MESTGLVWGHSDQSFIANPTRSMYGIWNIWWIYAWFIDPWNQPLQLQLLSQDACPRQVVFGIETYRNHSRFDIWATRKNNQARQAQLFNNTIYTQHYTNTPCEFCLCFVQGPPLECDLQKPRRGRREKRAEHALVEEKRCVSAAALRGRRTRAWKPPIHFSVSISTCLLFVSC